MNPFEWEAPYLVVVAGLFVIVMLRANGTYWLGRLVQDGARRTRRLGRLMRTPGYEAAVERLNRWGPLVVSASFLTVGVQTLVNLAAGGTRMPLRRYLPAVTAGCVLWAFLYGTVGFIGFEALALLWQRFPWAAVGLAVAVVAASAWFVTNRVREARLARAEAARTPVAP